MVAACAGHVGVCDALLKARAEAQLEAAAEVGHATALRMAAENGHGAVVALLGEALLKLERQAAAGGVRTAREASALEQGVDRRRTTPLAAAARNGAEGCVRE
eukprot:3601152-Prymnesium_polylepis.1